MWLLRSSPLELRAMLWAKYWVGTIPLLVLALAITVMTNVLLKATPFMMTVGVLTILLLTLAISAMALCFGTLYPQFETENAAQIPTSFGGLVYMMSSLSLLAAIIMVEAGPVTDRLRIERFSSSSAGSTAERVVAGAIVVLTCVAATIVPLRMALRTIERMEW